MLCYPTLQNYTSPNWTTELYSEVLECLFDALGSLKVKVCSQAVLVHGQEFRLASRSCIDLQAEPIAKPTRGELAFAYANHNPWQFYTPRLKKDFYWSGITAISRPIVVVRVVIHWLATRREEDFEVHGAVITMFPGIGVNPDPSIHIESGPWQSHCISQLTSGWRCALTYNYK